MNVDVIPAPKEFALSKIYGKTVIVLDIFRSTSTIVTALANGCREVIPVSTPQEARLVAAKHPNWAVVAGESEGVKVPGFDLGNSPLEFTEAAVRDKKVILATTNGTAAIKRSKPAKHVLIGSFLNLNAVCTCALAYHKDIVLFCAGADGGIALEDVLAAGCYLTVLKQYCPDLRLTELSETFSYLSNYFQDQMKSLLSTSRSGLNLQKLGYQDDLDFCLQKNRYHLVPVYKQGSIKLSQPVLTG